MRYLRPLLLTLAFLSFAGGIFVMTQPMQTQEVVLDTEIVWVLDLDTHFGLKPIGGPNCFTVCTDGCPGICRTCCTENGVQTCWTFSNGCNPF